MTDTKAITGLSEDPGALSLSPDAYDFLTSPYREKLLTEFSIGSNKLRFYGQLFVMARTSELIKTGFSKFVESPAPHVLLTHGVVLLRPMTLLWLYYNNYKVDLGQLSMTELLHMYRLVGYFGFVDSPLPTISESVIKANPEKLSDNDRRTLERIMSSPEMPYSVLVSDLTEFYRTLGTLGFDQKYISLVGKIIMRYFAIVTYRGTLTDEDNKVVAKLFNELFSQPDAIDYKQFLSKNNIDYLQPGPEYDPDIQRTALGNIFQRLAENPKIGALVNYIPVYIYKGIETYAERKAPMGNLGSLNTDWKADPNGQRFSKVDDVHDVTIYLEAGQWDSQAISFTIDVARDVDEIFSEEIIMNPIMT